MCKQHSWIWFILQVIAITLSFQGCTFWAKFPILQV